MPKKQSHRKVKQIGGQGYTLMEVMIVIAIFSIGILAVAAMQMTSTKSNASARKITEATALAENQIENLMQLSYNHDDLNPANNPYEINQGPYTINWNVVETDLNADGTDDSKIIDVNVNCCYGGDHNVSMQYIMPEY